MQKINRKISPVTIRTKNLATGGENLILDIYYKGKREKIHLDLKLTGNREEDEKTLIEAEKARKEKEREVMTKEWSNRNIKPGYKRVSNQSKIVDTHIFTYNGKPIRFIYVNNNTLIRVNDLAGAFGEKSPSNKGTDFAKNWPNNAFSHLIMINGTAKETIFADELGVIGIIFRQRDLKDMSLPFEFIAKFNQYVESKMDQEEAGRENNLF